MGIWSWEWLILHIHIIPNTRFSFLQDKKKNQRLTCITGTDCVHVSGYLCLFNLGETYQINKRKALHWESWPDAASFFNLSGILSHPFSFILNTSLSFLPSLFIQMNGIVKSNKFPSQVCGIDHLSHVCINKIENDCYGTASCLSI